MHLLGLGQATRCKSMSYKKTAVQKNKGHANNACLHCWQTVWGLMAVARPLAFLAAFSSISGLLGIVGPTLTQAQTVSTAPNLDADGWTVFTPSADTRIIYVSSSTGNDL